MSKAMAVAIASHKGGTGKTTTVLNLGHALARKGRKVLLIDLDSQANLTASFNKEVDEWVAKGKHIGRLLKGEKTLDEVAWQAGENLWLIPSTEQLGKDEEAVMGRMNRESILRKALAKYLTRYDYILFDTPPNLGLLTNSALFASDSYLIPMETGTFGYKGLQKIIQHVNQIYEETGITLGGVILTKYNPKLRGALKGALAEAVKGNPDLMPFQTYIRQNISIDEAQYDRSSLFTYAPNSNAAQDYDKLTDEFLNRYEHQG